MLSNQPLRIIHIAPLVASLGARAAGGAEQGVVALAEEQSKLHQVSIIAAKNSTFNANISLIDLDIQVEQILAVNTGNLDQRNEQEVIRREKQVFAKVFEFISQHANDYDIIHSHAYDFLPISELYTAKLPVVHTLHLPPIVPWINQALRAMPAQRKGLRYITASKQSQKLYIQQTGKTFPVIYYGIDVAQVPFSATGGDDLLWAGRISPEKGLHTAIDVVCKRLGQKLHVVGRIYDNYYFEREIFSQLAQPLIHYHNFLTRNELLALMASSQAFLFPIEWDEPFGLVLVESMAAGTPVVAFRRGAVEELLLDGETGFIVDDAQQMAEAVSRIEQIKRDDCRKHVERKFSLKAMAQKYEELYHELCLELISMP